MKARYVPVRYFLIALVPVTIFYLEAVITSHFLTAELVVAADVVTLTQPWLETAGRLRFLGATWFFAALAMLVFVMVLRDLARPMQKQTRIAAIVVMVVIFGLAVMPTFEHLQDPDGARNFHRLGKTVFENALGLGALPGCDTPESRWLLGACGDRPAISLLNRIMDLINVFAGLGVGALIVSMILCLDEAGTGSLEARAFQLERNLQRMRRQLYLSGLVLTFGIFFATSWMRWPLPMIAKDHSDAFAVLVSSASLFTGLYFSLLILSFYLPVALLLDGRRRELTLAAAQTPELQDPKVRAEWLKVRGLQSDPTDVYKSGFALAAPILAAFAGSLPITV